MSVGLKPLHAHHRCFCGLAAGVPQPDVGLLGSGYPSILSDVRCALLSVPERFVVAVEFSLTHIPISDFPLGQTVG